MIRKPKVAVILMLAIGGIEIVRKPTGIYLFR
jgi:hypothetical protein